ncbi:MAG: NADH-quinone oxidoreductase subunit NuoK [Elusimicrobia bacterium]|nr:NADH-quinone oxidoreductase subunit NuoK [Elusimicrobiota bacterium]
MVPLTHYLAVSIVLFGIGLFGVLARRNVLGVLMSIELMFNAANLNLVAFNHFLSPYRLWGQAFTIFVVTLAAAEAVVGLALVLAIYRHMQTVNLDRFNLLKG